MYACASRLLHCVLLKCSYVHYWNHGNTRGSHNLACIWPPKTGTMYRAFADGWFPDNITDDDILQLSVINIIMHAV